MNCLLELISLRRQYAVNGEVCDILALDKNGGLVVLELKNTEDRYIVQQLTRYYDNLISTKPWPQQINYEVPIRLIAIAPCSHKHNWIDKKYHKLNFEFLSFTIHQEDNWAYLILQRNTKIISRLKIL